MESSQDYSYYKKHAQDVKPEDITSSEQNKDIVQKLRDGDPDLTSLCILDEYEYNGDDVFFVEEADDLEWLGYFIGESKTLDILRLSGDPFLLPDGMIEGICRNQSIQSLDIKENEPADTTFFHFAPFFDRNKSLTSLTYECNSVGSDQSARNFSMALVKCKFLKHLCLQGCPLGGNQFSDEAFRDNIVTALSFLPQLEVLSFEEYWIEEGGYAALGNALRMGGMGKLRILNMNLVHVNDDGLPPLVAGMKHCQALVELNLYGNHYITVAGLRTLSAFLQSESCRLGSLNLGGLPMGDEGARVFAAGLKTNKSLKRLYLPSNDIGNDGITALVSGITAAAIENLESLDLSHNSFEIEGIRSLSNLLESERSCLKELDLGHINFSREANEEGAAAILANALANNTSLMYLNSDAFQNVGVEAFSKLLCDTSSINNIYSSNHTLEIIGALEYAHGSKHDDIWRYLRLNRNTRHLEPSLCQLVPMCKVLIHYPDLADMKSFFKWKLTFLPLVAAWFDRAGASVLPFIILDESLDQFQRRKLSAMYKFIRGVPLLVADGYWSQRLKQVHVKKRNFEEAEKQLLEMLAKERAKKRKLEEEETQLLDRLGGKRESD